MVGLDEPRLKLSGAKTHLGTLNREIERFLKTEPYVVVREYKAEWRQKVGVGRIRRDAPPELSLYIGDFTQNLRGSLDHLVYQLVRANGKTSVRDSAFPIYLDKIEFHAKGLPKIRNVHPDARTEIDLLQPYRRGDRAFAHSLAILNKFSNRDKHESLLFTAASVPIAGLQINSVTVGAWSSWIYAHA
jgi:hypothetical protein